MHEDGDQAILTGCTCGSKLFFYIRKDRLERIEQQRKQVEKLTDTDRKQIEDDIYEIIGEERKNLPIILDMESVNVSGPGKFELDLVQLFNKTQPLVYKMEEGKYVIDLPNSFRHKKIK